MSDPIKSLERDLAEAARERRAIDNRVLTLEISGAERYTGTIDAINHLGEVLDIRNKAIESRLGRVEKAIAGAVTALLGGGLAIVLKSFGG